ncbi:hypothetical protein HDV63DRAFT_357663 [Trichoderma sp. SZMC 28014]
MVHDYHLMMLPRLLRQRLPDAHVAFSLHTPCRRILEMPGRLGELIEGIHGSNVITFTEHGDEMNFGSWCAHRPSYWATQAMDVCSTLPLGIDVSGITLAAQNEAVSERCEILGRAFENRALVLSYGTPGSRTEMEEISRGFSRMLQLEPWLSGYVILLQVVCTSRDPRDDYSILDGLNSLGLDATVATISCEGGISELDFHALARCSDAAIFSFAPGGSSTAPVEYFLCQPRGSKRPIVSTSNPIFNQVPNMIAYRRGDIDSIVGAIHYTLDLPGGQWLGVPGTPRPEDCDVDTFYTAEKWTKYVLTELMANLLRGSRPAGTSSMRGSRSPQAFAEA